MRDGVEHNGTSAESGNGKTSLNELGDKGRQARNDFRRARQSSEELAATLKRATQTWVSSHPYWSVAIAAGTGYILGGGLKSHFSAALMNVGGKYVATRIFSGMLQPGGTVSPGGFPPRHHEWPNE